jgi:hypothetical protein
MRRVLKSIRRSPKQAIHQEKRWRALERRVQGLKKRNKDLPPEKLQPAIDEAVRETRAERSNRDERATGAETLFPARAARGAGKTKRGRRLLAKARGECARPRLKKLMPSARGVVDSGVADLASNPKHLEGFGRGRRRHR